MESDTENRLAYSVHDEKVSAPNEKLHIPIFSTCLTTLNISGQTPYNQSLNALGAELKVVIKTSNYIFQQILMKNPKL